MEPVVREATHADELQLADAWEEAYVGGGFVPASAREAIRTVARWRDEGVVLVATVDGEVVGGVVLLRAGSPRASVGGPADAEIRMLGVAERARGRGAARRLVEECIERARAADAAALTLWTRTTMTAAQRLYDRLGFARTANEDFPLADGTTALAYRLPLR